MRDAPAGSRIRPEVSPPGVVDRLARIPLSVASTAAGLARQRLVRPLDLRQYAPRPMRRTAADRRLAQRRTSSLDPTLPSISLVMPSLNQGAFLDQAIRSIFQQEYERLEVVVQDGGSTDASLAVLERYASALTSVRSAPDGGQADAINRGFASTDGEIMGWLNSDDLLLPGALMTIGEYFAAHPEVDVVYGNRVVIDETGREVGRWVLPSDTHEYLDWADYIPQETLYWRRSLWSAVGSRLDADVSFALDWELLLRFRDAGARFAHIPTYLGAFRVHEGSKTVSQVDGAGAADMDGIRQTRHGRAVGQGEIFSALVPLYLKAGVERGRSRMRTGARWVRSPAIGQRP